MTSALLRPSKAMGFGSVHIDGVCWSFYRAQWVPIDQLARGEGSLNKAELIDEMAAAADISKAAATRALDAMLTAVTDALKQSEQVALVGFGTFAVKDRPERMGRNPRTNEPMTIPAARVPSFKPGKALKDALNA